MKPDFKEYTSNPGHFFQILPDDWQDDIVSHWPHYSNTAKIFTLETEDDTIGGGIVFSTVSPDTKAYKEEAQKLFDRGFLYIGFLYISEQYRGKQFGTYWLEQLFQKMPDQKFWLSVDDFSLTSFYARLGFKLLNSVKVKEAEEWILVRI